MAVFSAAHLSCSHSRTRVHAIVLIKTTAEPRSCHAKCRARCLVRQVTLFGYLRLLTVFPKDQIPFSGPAVLHSFSLSYFYTPQVLATAITKSHTEWQAGCTFTGMYPALSVRPRARVIDLESYLVLGGAIVLRSRYLLPYLLTLVTALSLPTLASASSATANLTFLNPGSNASGGFYTYPYYFAINGGQATPMMCDSFTNHISTGENWNANVNGLLSGKGLFGKSYIDYKAAGIIFMGVVNGTISATTGNWAVWNLFDKGVTTDSSVLAIDSNALSAARYAPSSEFRGLALYTPVGGSPGHGPQEFIGFRGTPLATPEPGTLAMLSTGLLGIGGLVRRRLLA